MSVTLKRENMNNYEKYENKAGLLNSPVPNDQNINENTVLFTLVYCLRYYNIHGEWPEGVMFKIEQYMKQMSFKGEGSCQYKTREDLIWYRNVPQGDGLKGDQFTSRDQLIAYSVFSSINGDRHEDEIWHTLWKKLFTYNNVTQKFSLSRIVLPRDWIYIGYLAESWICYLLMPLYYIFAIFTCLQASEQRTSGAQLLWVQAHVDNHILKKPFWWIFNKILNYKFGTSDMDITWDMPMFSKYYPLEHPVNQVWFEAYSEKA